MTFRIVRLRGACKADRSHPTSLAAGYGCGLRLVAGNQGVVVDPRHTVSRQAMAIGCQTVEVAVPGGGRDVKDRQLFRLDAVDELLLRAERGLTVIGIRHHDHSSPDLMLHRADEIDRIVGRPNSRGYWCAPVARRGLDRKRA